jgi:hypothetical protein
MTNIYQPLGFQELRNKYGSGGGMMSQYTISAADSTLIGLNDLVKRSGGKTITKAGPADTPIGMFKGWQFRTRSPVGGSQGSAADGRIVPFFKAWTGAITINTNQYIEALVDDNPSNTYAVQCFSTSALAESNIGSLVDMVDCPGGPDISVFGRGKQGVSFPTTYFNITSYTVSAGGTGWTQNGVDLVVNGVIIDMRPSDITVAAGVITAITPLNLVQGLPSNSPTVTVQNKPGFSGGGGATITPVVTGAQTAAQFRIERILEKPFRIQDANNNTAGYDLTGVGVFPWVEVAYAKHGRGGTALFA